MTRLFISFFLLAALGGTVCSAQDSGILTVSGMPSSAPSVYGYKQIRVLYGNKFRFELGAQTTETPIGSAAIPGSLGLSSAAIAKLPTGIPQPPATAPAPEIANAQGAPPPPAAIPDYPEACNLADAINPWPQTPADQGPRITKCWNEILAAANMEKDDITNLQNKINVVIRNAAKEQRCYMTNLQNFREPILTSDQATALAAFATANSTAGNPAGCQQPNSEEWPLSEADQDLIAVAKLQEQLSDLATLAGYPAWLGGPGIQTANAALGKALTDLSAEVTAYSSGASPSGSAVAQTANDFQAVVANNLQWRKRLSSMSMLATLEIDINLDPCNLFYGKGRTDAVKLHAVDLSTTAGASQDISLANNTCNPRTIASTGVGVSFLPSPVFGFVPGDNTGTQVIGETATNSKSPLYAVFYNVQLWNLGHGAELFASPGVGLTSASSTTNGDFLGGLSLSLARRTIFITPAVDLGRRDELAPGFSLGTPKGSLSSVPTRSHWPVQFMLSISFGIGPS